MEVVVEGPEIGRGSSEGMLLDFAKLKRAIDIIVGAWDHKTLLRAKTDRLGLLEGDYVVLGIMPTAENLAALAVRVIGSTIDWPVEPPLTGWDLIVRIWETPTSYAECSAKEAGKWLDPQRS
jgi:6-pyruvoyl-tetrahydropterin synthase